MIMANLPTTRTMPVFSVLLLVVAAVIGTVSSEQRFLETPVPYQEVSEGDDVRLKCKIQDLRGQCLWQKDHRPVGQYENKYEWETGRDGDCSLLIKKARLEYDDGHYECQVTASDFKRQDSLTSPPSRLLIRAKPNKPTLEFNGAPLLTTAPLTLREGQDAAISCFSRYGNPPALIKWYIGSEEVLPTREQSNQTEIDKPKTSTAHSILFIRANRDYHNKPVKCLAMHPTTTRPDEYITESRFDIQYSPVVRLETSPRLLVNSLEDSASFVSLRCVSDSNPPASIKWFKDSSPIMQPNNVLSHAPLGGYNRTHANYTISESELRFEPIKREDAGAYSCRAVNLIGESPPAHYSLDVQFGPKPRSIDSNSLSPSLSEIEETAALNDSIEPFECPEFDANPQAMYRWEHVRSGNVDKIDNRGTDPSMRGRRLRLNNVGWADEGEYRCVAYNNINGVDREMPSDMRFTLHIVGPPQIQSRPSAESGDGSYESIGWSGERVHQLKSKFCSMPPPRIVAWQWGSLHTRAGDKNLLPKYEALDIEPIFENKAPTNCYWAKLQIRDLRPEDARRYTLTVESDKGRDSNNLRLIVRDPTELRIIAAAGAVGLLVLLLLFAVGVYSLVRSRRKHREYTKEDEEGSISADQYYGTTQSNGNANDPGNAATIERNGQLKQSLQQQQQRHQQQQQQQHLLQQQQQQQQLQKGGMLAVVNGGGGGGGSPYGRKQGAIVEGGLAVMYDYDQIACKSRAAMSPEALKVRRAPAVLQPPTIV